jgi:hypothetical protein
MNKYASAWIPLGCANANSNRPIASHKRNAAMPDGGCSIAPNHALGPYQAIKILAGHVAEPNRFLA